MLSQSEHGGSFVGVVGGGGGGGRWTLARKYLLLLLLFVMVWVPIVGLSVWFHSIALLLGLGIPATVFLVWVTTRW